MSLVKAFLYSLASLDYICVVHFTYGLSKEGLSDQLVFYPYLLAMIASDLVIHVGCASTSRNVAKLIRILDGLYNYHLPAQDDPAARLIYAGLIYCTR